MEIPIFYWRANKSVPPFRNNLAISLKIRNVYTTRQEIYFKNLQHTQKYTDTSTPHKL